MKQTSWLIAAALAAAAWLACPVRAEPFPELDDAPAGGLAALEQTATASPADAPIAIKLAKLYRKLGYDDKAEKLYLRLLSPSSPTGSADRAEACNGLGFIYETRKDYPRAMEQYQQALQLRPTWSRPLMHIACCQMDQGDYEAAQNSLKAAMQADPGDASVRNCRGILFSKMSEPEAAEAEYRAAIRLRPGWAGPVWNLVLLLDAQGEYRESDKYLDRLLELNPDHLDALYVRVQHLVGGRDYSSAEREARNMVARFPDRAEAHEALGMALWSREDMEGAEAAFRKALELDPKSAGAYLGLGHVRMQQKRYGEAEEHYKRALAIDPGIMESRKGYEQAKRAREHERIGGGCSAAPSFATVTPLGPLQCLCVIIPVVLRRRRG